MKIMIFIFNILIINLFNYYCFEKNKWNNLEKEYIKNFIKWTLFRNLLFVIIYIFSIKLNIKTEIILYELYYLLIIYYSNLENKLLKLNLEIPEIKISLIKEMSKVMVIVLCIFYFLLN